MTFELFLDFKNALISLDAQRRQLERPVGLHLAHCFLLP
jgi:hypothetical protein